MKNDIRKPRLLLPLVGIRRRLNPMSISLPKDDQGRTIVFDANPGELERDKKYSNTPPWKIELIPIKTTSLKNGQKFRWYNCGFCPLFTFDKIQDTKIISFDSSGNIFTWTYATAKIVYIEKN